MLARIIRGHTYRTRAIGRMELADKTQLADFRTYLIGRGAPQPGGWYGVRLACTPAAEAHVSYRQLYA